METNRSTEKGQILVLLALVLVGLLGFTALAVDGGMIYADRRYMQSSADASSLAGAGDLATGLQELGMNSQTLDCDVLSANYPSAYSVAQNKAAANDFTIAATTDLGTGGNNNGVMITCNEDGGYVDVNVMLTRDTTTSFVHLFNGGPMRNTVTSISRVLAGFTAGNGSSIVSLSKECQANQEGGFFGGNNETHLINGGVWSNSCIRRTGNALVKIEGGSIDYHPPYTVIGLSQPIPTPQTEYHPMTTDPLIGYDFQCVAPTHDPFDDPDDGKVYGPGIYSDWDMKEKVFLEPGLYCLSGTLSTNADTLIKGDGVTIYFTGDKFEVHAQAKLILSAPDGYGIGDVIPGNALEDLLFYAPTASTVTINGGSDNFFSGTIYAPQALIKVNGNEVTGDIQEPSTVSIIGYGVRIVGTSTVTLKYDPDKDWSVPAAVQIQQ